MIADTSMILIIKALTVRRGMAPAILSKLLNDTGVSMSRFRAWMVCDTTWRALQMISEWDNDRIRWEEKIRRSCGTQHSWVLELIGENVYRVVTDIVGPDDATWCGPGQLGYQIIPGISLPVPAAFYIPPEDKMDLVRDLVF